MIIFIKNYITFGMYQCGLMLRTLFQFLLQTLEFALNYRVKNDVYNKIANKMTKIDSIKLDH